MIRLLFSRSMNPGSLIIRAMTGFSEWSHVAVIEEDVVVQATPPRVEAIHLEDALRGRAWAIKEVHCNCPYNAYAFGRQQVGKRYDYRFLFGFITNRDWRDNESWACSELAAAQIEAGNSAHIVMPGAANRVTPEYLWLLPGKVVESQI